jgi:hypothetical protein
MKQTETSAVIKVWGLTGTTTDTINLSTDLLSPTMVVSGTPTVNVNYITWCVTAGASDLVTITRNSVPLGYFYQNGQFDFGGEGGWTEDTNNTSNIVVTIVGSGVAFITVRKVAGYKSKINPETYGSYDNTTSTTS